MKTWQYGLQTLNYIAFMAVVGYFSDSPAYRQLTENEALVALAFGHSGQPVSECVHKTAEELAKLPPNLRLPMVCPRERSPIDIEMSLDEKVVFKQIIQAPGLSKDGGIDVYHRFKIPAGQHQLSLKLKDSVLLTDYNYVHNQTIDLNPHQVIVISFKHELGGFIVK
jgi:hypothetical protein